MKKDALRAYQWFSVALDQGFRDAVVARDGIAAEMTDAEIAIAETLTEEWLHEHGGWRH